MLSRKAFACLVAAGLALMLALPLFASAKAGAELGSASFTVGS